ncbi:hypothetical protein [Kitasatospora sp. A2-31]|nr:hypothetical protein [Kitasatospora sp. A2-31]MCG6495269.1 hypothetical protein [Kitasatospora sp. A2-31]
METTSTDTAVEERQWPQYLDLELLLSEPDLLAVALPARSLDVGHAGGCG